MAEGRVSGHRLHQGIVAVLFAAYTRVREHSHWPRDNATKPDRIRPSDITTRLCSHTRRKPESINPEAPQT
eukprot:1598528-Rhodomonas_salina.4